MNDREFISHLEQQLEDCRDQVARLKAALRPFAKIGADKDFCNSRSVLIEVRGYGRITGQDLIAALEALDE